MKVYLSYRESRRGGECRSDEPYSDRDPAYTEFDPLGLYSKKGDWNQEVIVYDESATETDCEVGDQLYLLVVRYSSGDSFGSTYGNWTVIGAFTNLELANKIQDVINNDEGTYFEDSSYYEEFSQLAYPDWLGYFERLETTNIFPYSVIGGKCPGVYN